MDVPRDDKLLLFLAFFVPGFTIRQIYGLFVGIDQADTQKLLPTIVGFSALHYGVTAFPLFILPPGSLRDAYAYIDVLLLPIVWAPVALLVRDYSRWKPVFFSTTGFKISGPGSSGWVKGFNEKGIIVRGLNANGTIRALLSPEGAPWDKVLTDEARFIRIRLKSGRFVGGYYGLGSAASTYPGERQVFVSEMYSFSDSGEFGTRIARTGVLIQGDEIETLEIVGLPPAEQNNEQSE